MWPWGPTDHSLRVCDLRPTGAMQRYNKLHQGKEDERYCDELPCTEAATPPPGPLRSRRESGV